MKRKLAGIAFSRNEIARMRVSDKPEWVRLEAARSAIRKAMESTAEAYFIYGGRSK